jgi:glutaredoxin
MTVSMHAPHVMSEIELYDRQDCPYSQKVRDKLEALEVEYEETVVPDRHTDREELHERTGQRGVPCLFDPAASQDFIADSDEIITHLERTHA